MYWGEVDLGSPPQQMHHHPAPLPVLPVFKHIYSLPGPQSKASLLQRDRKVSLRQGCLDMRRHVVGSLGGMAVRAIRWCDAAEKILQIATHIRVGIFLNGERCRCMLDEQIQQAILHTLLLAPIHYWRRDLVKPRAICIGVQNVSDLPHPLRVTEYRPASAEWPGIRACKQAAPA